MSRLERLIYRFANVAMRVLLCSPLHTFVSGKVLLLTVTGHKSGRSYAVPVSYVEDDGALVCFTSDRWGNWWKNLRGGARGTVRLRGRQLAGIATVDNGDDENVARKLRAFLQRFPGSAQRYGVGLNCDGHPEPRDVDLAVRRGGPIMIRINVG